MACMPTCEYQCIKVWRCEGVEVSRYVGTRSMKACKLASTEVSRYMFTCGQGIIEGHVRVCRCVCGRVDVSRYGGVESE